MSIRFTIIIFFLLGIVFSCQEHNRNRDKKENILSFPLSQDISTLDPANAYDTLSASVVYQCYEQLYQYHYLKRPYVIEPLLAEGMPKVSKGGLHYTIRIKKNIVYHNDSVFNGKKRFVTAQDFITQIKRLAFKPTRSNGWWLFDGKIKGLNKWRDQVGQDLSLFEQTSVEGLKAIDDHTLVIELLAPYPQMLPSLAMSFTSPLPIEAVRKYNNLFNEKVIGTGPYKLDKWTKLSGLKISRFSDYRDSFYPSQGDRTANSMGLLKDAGKKIPFIDNIHFKIIREAQPRWLNFRSKKIDLILIPKDNFTSAIRPNGTLTDELKREGIKLQVFPTLTYWWLAFNMKDPLLGKNKNLRMAIAHAVDFKRYINVFTNSIGQKANSIYPPGIPGYSPSSRLPYKYDIIKAKKYLKKAGFPEGRGLPILSFDTRGSSTTNRQQAEFIKSQLAKVGISIKVTTNTFPHFLKKARNGKLQFWQDGWAMDYPDAENVLQLLVSKNHSPGPNATYYSNKNFDKKFDQLKLLFDGRQKFKLMKEMENIINQDMPWVMQYYSRTYMLYHSTLKNYRPSDLIYNNLKYLKIESNN